MKKSNLVKVLAVATFCSLPFSLVAINSASAAGIAMEDTITTSLNLIDSGNSSYYESAIANSPTVHYNYAVYTGENNALIAITAEGPSDSLWQKDNYKYSVESDPFASILPKNNWKSERIVKMSGNKATIYDYREIDNGQSRSDMENNAKELIQKVEKASPMKTKPSGNELSAKMLKDYMPKLKSNSYLTN